MLWQLNFSLILISLEQLESVVKFRTWWHHMVASKPDTVTSSLLLLPIGYFKRFCINKAQQKLLIFGKQMLSLKPRQRGKWVLQILHTNSHQVITVQVLLIFTVFPRKMESNLPLFLTANNHQRIHPEDGEGRSSNIFNKTSPWAKIVNDYKPLTTLLKKLHRRCLIGS